MNRHFLLILAVFLAITAAVFVKPLTKGYVPFPGDLLLSEYQPWKMYGYGGYTPGSIPNKAQYFDAVRQMYPWQAFSTAQLTSGRIPLWNPHNFSGAPLMANTQSAVFYPPKLLYMILPQPVAWTILIVSQVLLSMAAMYLFVRSIGGSRTGSVLSAVSYALCLYQASFLEYNIMGHYLYLLGFSLWGTERFIISRRMRYASVMLLTLTLAWYAGHLQLAVTLTGAVMAYTAIRMKLAGVLFRSGTGAVTAAVFVIAVLAGAPQLLPTAELIANSARSLQPADFLINHLMIQPYQLLTAVIPDLFGNPASRNYLLADSYPTKALSIGFLPLLSAVAALAARKRHTHVPVLLLTALPFALLIVRTPVSELLFRMNVPLLGTSSPSNMIFVVSFVAASLAGLGWDGIATLGRKKSILMAGGMAVLFCTAFLLPKTGIAVNTKNLLLSAGIAALATGIAAAAVLFPKTARAAGVAAVLLTAAELTYFLWKFNPFVPASYLYPANSLTAWFTAHASGPERVWGYASAGTQPNVDTVMGIHSPDGYDPLYPKSYGEFVRSSATGNIVTATTNRTRSDAVIDHGWGESDLATNRYRLKALALLGVRYVYTHDSDATSERTFPPGVFTLTDSFDGWKIFTYDRALPRAFMTDRVERYGTPEAFSKRFYADDFDPATTVLADTGIPLHPDAATLSATATISGYTPSSVTVTTTSNKAAVLVLSDTYYPGWSAYVDGAKTSVHRVDYTLRGVVVPGGRHTVMFVYRPVSFTAGVGIAGLAALLTVALIRILKRTGYVW